jgi:hypothetical protein
MRCLKSVVFSCFIVLFFSQAGRGQDPFYWKLTDENGLPSQTVYQVLQDHYGLIWIATANGLCTFDGKYVQNFDCSALNDQEILKIQEGPDGKIWGLNLSGQLFCFSNGKIEVINELGGVKLGKLTDFYLFQNKLFFGDFVGVGRSSNFFCYDFDTYSTTIFNFNLRGMLFSIVQSESNLILYTRSSFYGNIFLLDTKLNYKFKLVDSVYLPSTKHICFYNDKLLVPMENGKIKFLNLLTKNSDIELSVSSPTKNIINIAGFLYFIQSKGVVKTDLKNKVQLFSEVTINSIFKDREGNYFFSSNQGVLIQPSTSILGKNFHSITYSDKKINSIARLNSKVVLFADESGRLYENKNLQRKNYYFSSINSVTINSITGEKVIGADNGLFLSESKKPIVKTSIKCTFSARNCIYFGASQIFGKVVGSSYEVIKQVRTYAIAQTKDGLIWVGSDKGIYTYDGKNVMPYINQENNAHVPYRVTDMKTDASGRLWVTTLGHGVLVIVNNKIEKTFNKAQKLSTNTVNCVAFDNSYTWLGSDKGVYRCEYTKMEFLNINKYFGLPSDDIFALCPNKYELFIGTSKGLVLMPYEVMKPNMVPPNIRLNRVMVNDSIMPLSQNKFDLGRHENNLFIEYVSYQYRSKGEARYEYRIPELDTDWTMTDQRFLKFTNLSSGSYHLEIRAVNECDVRSTDFIRLHFDIAKPIWLQWWFVVGCVFAAGGGAWLFTFNNFKRKEKQQKKESEFKAKI